MIYKTSNLNINIGCVNCVLMKEQLCNALMELKSARRVIKLLQEDIDKFNASGASNTVNPVFVIQLKEIGYQ